MRGQPHYRNRNTDGLHFEINYFEGRDFVKTELKNIKPLPMGELLERKMNDAIEHGFEWSKELILKCQNEYRSENMETCLAREGLLENPRQPANAWLDECRHWLTDKNVAVTEHHIQEIATAMDAAGEKRAEELAEQPED